MGTSESKGTPNKMLEGTMWTSFLPSGVGEPKRRLNKMLESNLTMNLNK